PAYSGGRYSPLSPHARGAPADRASPPSLSTMPSQPNADKADKNLIDRALGAFTDVKAGEGITALLLTLDVFLLLTAYYLLKTVREPLILASGGAEVKSYAS